MAPDRPPSRPAALDARTRLFPAPLPQAPLDAAQRLACLRLIRSDNVGPVTFRELINHFGGAAPLGVVETDSAPAVPSAEDGDRASPPEVAPQDLARLLAALGPAPIDIDELARATRLPARALQIALIELALAGRIERHGHQLVSLASEGQLPFDIP